MTTTPDSPPMLRVSDLLVLAPFSLEAFRLEVGPCVLVQRPPEPVLAQVALQVGAARTVTMSKKNRLADEIVAMVKRFDHLLVYRWPKERETTSLSIGRHPACDWVIHEPSVSQRHATLHWSAERKQCTVRDVGSTNGTFIGTGAIGSEDAVLVDGDVLSLGDAQFLFLLAETLHAQLQSMQPR